MARVIKGGGVGGGPKPARPATRMIVDAGDKKIIERAVFQAKQDAEHILRRADDERQAIIAEGKKAAARAREEAMTRGASEAFATAAAEALAAFKSRADRYAEAADDIRALAMEVARKVLGTEPDLGPRDIDKVMQKGMAQLRARRRLRLQVSPRRVSELGGERPNLMKALQSEPDLVIESVDDVSTGFARVVTEVGGALCAEDTALDALAATVNVREQPRQQRAQTGVTTNAGTAPSGLKAFRDISGTGPGTDRSGGAGPPSVSDADVEELAPEEENDETMNLAPASSRRRADPLSATGKVGAERRHHGAASASTVSPSATSRSRSSLRGEDVEEIEAEEDDVIDEPTARRKGFHPNDISATGRGSDDDDDGHDFARGSAGVVVGGGATNRRPIAVAPGRAATRAVPLPSSNSERRGSAQVAAVDDDDGDETMRQAPLLRDSESEPSDAEDLDLFTDDAVRTPRKKR